MTETPDAVPPRDDAAEPATANGIVLTVTNYLFSATPLERLRRHDQSMELIRAAGREFYGSQLDGHDSN